MENTNKSLHLKNLARDAFSADPANPYRDWSPPTMARAAKTASSSAAASPASFPAPGSGDRLNQINKAFSSASPDDPFSADDIFNTEDAATADPFLAYAKQGGDHSAASPLNQPSATASQPQPDPVFAKEVEEAVADPIFAEPPTPPSASGASRVKEQEARSFFTPPPSPQQQVEGPFDGSASLEGDEDEADGGEGGEDPLVPAPPQSSASLPLEDAGMAPAEAAPAEAAANDHASDETISADPAQLSVTARFSKPAQFMESPAPAYPASAPQDHTAAPETTAAATLTLSTDAAAAESRDAPAGPDGNGSEAAAASKASDHYEPLPPAEPSGLHAEPLPEPQIVSSSVPEETTEDGQDESEDWGGLVQTPLEEDSAVDSLVQDSDMSVDFSEELDTLKTQVDSLIASYNQIHKENSELKRQCAEAEESVRRYAEDCQQLHIENEQLKPLRTLNRELQEEVAEVQREKRRYEGIVRNIRDKNREAASAMHKMIVRLGDIAPSL